jgi:hypothetical protein
MDPKTTPTLPPRTTPRSTSPSPKTKNTSKQRTPKKGRDIGNDIICKFCKLVKIRFKAPSISRDALES